MGRGPRNTAIDRRAGMEEMQEEISLALLRWAFHVSWGRGTEKVCGISWHMAKERLFGRAVIHFLVRVMGIDGSPIASSIAPYLNPPVIFFLLVALVQ